MWQRFTWYDVRVIGHYLGMLVLFSSVALIVPLVTAIVFREWVPASHYLLSIGLSLIVEGMPIADPVAYANAVTKLMA